MTMFRWFLVLTATAALTACASRPEVRVDRDPAVDLATYRTFAFFEPLATDTGRYSTLMTARLRQATRAEMERRGYTYDASSPDLRVNFYVRIADRQELRSGTTGFHGYRAGLYRGWSGYDLETVNYKAGTLAVDLVAAKARALVWQGVAEGRVDKKAMRDPDAAIDSAVAEIFKRFPSAAHKNG